MEKQTKPFYSIRITFLKGLWSYANNSEEDYLHVFFL